VTRIETLPHPIEPLSRVRIREYSGESEAVPLVEWLNAKPTSKKKKRVIQLLHLLSASVSAQKTMGSTEYSVLMAAAKPHYKRISRVLAHYRYVPDIRLTADGYLWSTPLWRLPRFNEPYDDYRAVWAIGRLCELGRFRAIHECDGCGKWMFAKRTDSATCSATCRARKMRDSMPEWRKRIVLEKLKARYWKKKEQSQ
jgi:hypothetical protein